MTKGDDNRAACARRHGCTNLPDFPVCRVCPFKFECPVCHSGDGAPCYRPSGHKCAPHAPRLDLADMEATARGVAVDWDRGGVSDLMSVSGAER